MTRPLTRTPVIAAALAALMTLTAILAGATPAASQTPTVIDEGHYDLVAEIDCLSETIELIVENHDMTTETYAFDEVEFEITSSNAFGPTAGDISLLDLTPLRVLSEEEDDADFGFLVIGLEVEPANCGTTPAVTFDVDTSASVTDGRAAAYVDDQASETQLDTESGTDQNVGATVTGHDDRRWAFEVDGVYEIAIVASFDFGSGVVSEDDLLTVDVS